MSLNRLPYYPGAVIDEMAWQLLKYVHEEVRLRSDYEHEHEGNLFTFDMVLEGAHGKEGPRMGILCTDPTWETDPQLTRDRDERAIRSGAVDVLYRLAGPMLHDRIEDALYFVVQTDPQWFTGRAQVNSHVLASHEAKGTTFDGSEATVEYLLDATDPSLPLTLIEWHARTGLTPALHVRRLVADTIGQ